jgi:carbamoyl-phosphate synthase large subunit
VGGGVGQSILKALSLATLPIEVYAIDVQPLSAGLYTAEHRVVLPKPETADALHTWGKWLTENKIDALIPGSDHDLLPLARVRQEWAARGITYVLVSDLALVEICRDKASTVQYLAGRGLPHPRSVWDIDLEQAVRFAGQVGFPLVLKPRHGFASRGMEIIRDRHELEFFFPRTPEPILQEYLHRRGEVEEFTCAVFVNETGEPGGTFMARRDLASGATYRAEVGYWQEIDVLLGKIGRAFKPRGPLNVQLRLTGRGPVPFELNIRCSGTAGIRAHFGYNEPEMMLRHFLLGEELATPAPRTGYVLRYWNEVFLDGVTRDELLAGNTGVRGEVRAWP